MPRLRWWRWTGWAGLMHAAATAQRTAATVLCVQCWLAAQALREHWHVGWCLNLCEQLPLSSGPLLRQQPLCSSSSPACKNQARLR